MFESSAKVAPYRKILSNIYCTGKLKVDEVHLLSADDSPPAIFTCAFQSCNQAKSAHLEMCHPMQACSIFIMPFTIKEG
jgi:hypothetical protein